MNDKKLTEDRRNCQLKIIPREKLSESRLMRRAWADALKRAQIKIAA